MAQKTVVIHKRSLRLHNNTGMNFPVCFAGADKLDTSKSKLTTAPEWASVTCTNCKRKRTAAADNGAFL